MTESLSATPSAASREQPLRCFLVGATGMAARCGELLRARGFEMRGVFSEEPTLQRWARSLGLDCQPATAEAMAGRLGAESFELLFSVINPRILPPEILALPRVAAINYHDGPLPAYAGVNAPAWAILNGEREHGVCWAWMTPMVDAGDLLAQASVPIADEDTAQSLNLRCTEAGLRLFERLLEDLRAGRPARVPQDLTRRTYHGPAERPFAGGFVRWDRPADEILRLVRGLSFGRFDNPLALPKLVIDDQPYSFAAAAVAEPPSAAEAPPGSAQAEAGGALLVRCQDRWLRVSGLAALGSSSAVPQAAETAFAGAAGRRLDVGAYPFDLERFDAVFRESARSESFWLAAFERSEGLDLPLVGGAQAPSGAGRATRRLTFDPARARCHPFVVLVLFLVRLCGAEDLCLRVRPGARPPQGMRACFLDEVPFALRCPVGEPLAASVARAEAHLEQALTRMPPSADLLRRYAGFEHWEASPFTVAVDRGGVEVAADGDWPAEAFWARYEVFAQDLDAVLARPGAADDSWLRDIALAGEGERRRVLEISTSAARPYDLSKTYIAHFAERVGAHAERVAVRCGGRELRYAELARQAAAVAERLAALGLPPNSTVAVAAERQIALVPVLLGIFAAGHAYLPLEPERYPPERLQAMLGDAEVRAAVVFSDAGRRSLADFEDLQLLAGEALVAPAGPEPDDGTAFGLAPLLSAQAPERTAYLIYTSGSTGLPKGVMVGQRNLVNHNLAVIETFALSAEDRVLQLGALGFDLSVEEIFPTLLTGACLVLLPDGIKESAPDFFAFLRREGITFLDLPTAFWHAMVAMLEQEPIPPSVRLVVIGGEKASLEHAGRWRRFAPAVRLINTYGPTETTIIATATENLATIGRPIANTAVLVLDHSGRLCPPGVIGELHIGGEAVAKGYLHRDQLTAAAFVPDPFAAERAALTRSSGMAPAHAAGETPPARLYRTGDRASFAADGELLFFGRADGQVKINGFRIETDEIKQALLGAPGVSDAAVVAVTRGASSGTDERLELACYFVADPQGSDAAALRARLEQALPAYMVPRHWIAVDAIPLNRNGKVDTKALPPPAPPTAACPADGGCLDPDVDSTTELQIAAALRSALRIEHYDSGASFDALGGDSLSAIRFLLELEKLSGQRVPVEMLYQAESMAALAREIDAMDERPWSPLVTLKSGDAGKPPLFLIHTTPGDVLGYINLVRHLDDRTVYGIQARGLDLSAEPAGSIAEMAADYVGILRETLPAGPYYLCGWCYGGIVATEMVAQLERSGTRVALFAPIETWGQPAPSLRGKLRKLANLIAWGPRGWGRFVRGKLGAWRGAPSVEDQDLDELDFIAQRFGSSRSADELERMKAVYRINTGAADRYVMPPVRTRVELLMIEPEANPERIPDKHFWWRGIAADRRVQLFDGDHATVLKEPAVEAVGRALTGLLQAADQGRSAAPAGSAADTSRAPS